MLELVSDTFVATVISAESLNVNTIEKGWQSLVVVGTLAVTMILLMCTGHCLDVRAYHEMEKLKKTSLPGSHQLSKQNMLSSKYQLMRNSSMSILPSGMKTDINISQTKVSASMSFLQIAEEALPQVLSSRSLFVKYKDELKRHHRWAGVFFHFTKKFPRALRVLSLATNIITMLFIQSITYNLTNGDDGSCGVLQTEGQCLEPSSSFSAGSSKCYWISGSEYDQATERCKFVHPESNLNVIVFVAIVSAVVSTPIAITLDWVIQHVLAAPTIAIDKSRIVAIVPSQEPSALSTITIVPGNHVARTRRTRRKGDLLLSDEKHADLKNAQNDLQTISEQLKLYRMTLSDKGEFDGKNNKFELKVHV
jgi:hypothetical protein